MKKKTLNSNFLSISGYILQPEVMLSLCLDFEEFQPIYTYAIKVMLTKKMFILGAANAQLLCK